LNYTEASLCTSWTTLYAPRRRKVPDRHETKIAPPALTPSSAEKGQAMDPIGHKRWAIAEGYIPSQSSFSDRALISHETTRILNAGDADAHVAITIFFGPQSGRPLPRNGRRPSHPAPQVQ
jgi:hypothetical protein